MAEIETSCSRNFACVLTDDSVLLDFVEGILPEDQKKAFSDVALRRATISLSH
jgi:hypothetical protein